MYCPGDASMRLTEVGFFHFGPSLPSAGGQVCELPIFTHKWPAPQVHRPTRGAAGRAEAAQKAL